jgi:hypothetical protein
MKVDKITLEMIISHPEKIDRDLVKILSEKMDITEEIWDRLLRDNAMELFIDSKYYGNMDIPRKILCDALEQLKTSRL